MFRRLIRTLAVPLCLLIIGCLSVSTTRVFAQTNSVSSIAWSPDGRKIASGYSDGTVKIWDTEKGAVLHTLTGHTDEVFALAWSRDGKKIVSGSDDKTLRIWDAMTGSLLNTLLGHKDVVEAVAWSSDGKRIISGSVEEPFNLRVWDAATGKPILNTRDGSILQIVWKPNSNQFALAYPDGISIYLNAETFQDAVSYEQPEGVGKGYDVYRLAWNPDVTQIASGSWNGVVRVWDIATGRIIVTLAGNDNPEEGYDTSCIRDLTFTLVGRRLKSLSADGTIREWDAQNWRVLSTTQIGSPVTAAAWSPDGTKIAYGDNQGNVRVIIPSTTLKLDQARQVVSDTTGAEVNTN